MATEEWYWQGGTAERDYLQAVSMGSDGSSVLAGQSYGLFDGTNADTSDTSLGPVATKLDADGNVLWTWQNVTGTSGFLDAAMDQDESVVLASDGVVTKLDADGNLLWVVEHNITAYAAAAGGARSIVTAGSASGGSLEAGTGFVDFAAFSLDADSGELLWAWQDGTEGFDAINGAILADEGESVVMAGYTTGSFSGVNAGSYDFAAVKLNLTDGSEVWRWQDGTDGLDGVTAVAETADGTGVVLVGYTDGDWGGDSEGDGDFAVVMLDVDGNESWRWQDGTTESEWLVGVAVQNDESILLAGQQKETDTAGDESIFFTALKLRADGEEVTWRWQAGPTGNASRLYGMAAGSDGKMILAGYTDGSWGDDANLGSDDFVAVMLSTIPATPAPSSPGDHQTGGPTGAPSTPAKTTPVPSSASNSPVGGLTDISSGDGSASSTAPIIAGALSTVAIVALSAVGFLLRKRRAAKKKGANREDPSAPPIDGLEDGQQHGVSLSKSAVVYGGDNPTLHQNNHSPPANHIKSADAAANGEGAVAVSATQVGGSVPFSTSYTGKAAGIALAGGAAEDYPAQQIYSMATTSAVDNSTLDRADVAGIASDAGEEAVFSADGPKPASSAAGRRGSYNDVGVGRAVMLAAQELAQRCQIPGVSEAAATVSILVNLVTDSRDSNNKGDATLKQCRSIVMALERAATVAGEAGNATGEVARILIEDVHDAVFDLAELIKTFRSKNKVSKVLMSTLFKRRQDELDAVVDRAILRLQLGLQVQVGHDVNAVKNDVSAVKEGMLLYKGSLEEAKSESLAEARSTRRQRKLDQIEIPEEHLTVTGDLLGKGGFGEVFLADYNGRNAACKVVQVAHDRGALSEIDELEESVTSSDSKTQRDQSQRRAFLRELEAMIRLQSPHTVNVYGAVTCLPDRLILVMELLSGGDLRTLLSSCGQPFPEEQSRQIIGDVCSGMAFLHSKDTVHGDLKSANVLLDGGGRAKV
ncbi:unnamed protein product [Ectocarpus fasciculatus]